MPDTHEIKFTPFWLLGFIEGDALFSIFLSRKISFEIYYSSNKKLKKRFLEAIQTFLLELPGSYNISRINSKPVQIIEYDSKHKN